MMLVAGLRYVPSLMYVVFLCVICRLKVVTVYQRIIIPTANTANVIGQYRITHIDSVPPSPNY